MRKVPSYGIDFFWEDNTPIENVKDTFSQIQMNKFLVDITIGRLNKLPRERREELFNEILRKYNVYFN